MPLTYLQWALGYINSLFTQVPPNYTASIHPVIPSTCLVVLLNYLSSIYPPGHKPFFSKNQHIFILKFIPLDGAHPHKPYRIFLICICFKFIFQPAPEIFILYSCYNLPARKTLFDFWQPNITVGLSIQLP